MCSWITSRVAIIILRPRQTGRHFAKDIFKYIFLNENTWLSIDMSCSWGSNQQYSTTDSDNGLAPTRQQAIIWTNDDKSTSAHMHHSDSMSYLRLNGYPCDAFPMLDIYVYSKFTDILQILFFKNKGILHSSGWPLGQKHHTSPDLNWLGKENNNCWWYRYVCLISSAYLTYWI